MTSAAPVPRTIELPTKAFAPRLPSTGVGARTPFPDNPSSVHLPKSTKGANGALKAERIASKGEAVMDKPAPKMDAQMIDGFKQLEGITDNLKAIQLYDNFGHINPAATARASNAVLEAVDSTGEARTLKALAAVFGAVA